MLNINMSGKEKKIPESWEEMTIEQYQKFINIGANYNTNDFFMELIQIFFGLSPKILLKMEYVEYQKLLNLSLAIIIDIPSDFANVAPVPTVKYDGKTYTATPFYQLLTEEMFAIDNLIKADMFGNIDYIVALIYKTDEGEQLTRLQSRELNIKVGLFTANFILTHVQN